MNNNNNNGNAPKESTIKRYTPQELAEKRRAERRAAEAAARRFKDKYLEFYDDIKQPEKPSW